ncbi:hypothetical protein Droror1_Dr00015271 [Drosera rotundifolia]
MESTTSTTTNPSPSPTNDDAGKQQQAEVSPHSPANSDWERPFTDEELLLIDAAFEAAASAASRPPPLKIQRLHYHVDGEPISQRRLPASVLWNLEETGNDCPPSPRPRAFGISPCSRSWGSRPDSSKMRYPVMSFGGEVIYSRTFDEVDESASQILKLLESRRNEMDELVLGLDIEWKPTFGRGIPPGKAAVLQICGNMTHCYVMHIIHSGIPRSLCTLLEDSSSIKVGVGIDNDAVKVFHDYNVSIRSVLDLSSLANQKFEGESRHWSLSSLVETLTCKQLLKPKKIRLGNWETDVLSKAQLSYAATDAFASWYLYQALKTFPDKSKS